MDYFDLEGIKDYQNVSQTAYKSETKESNWFYDTREKLKYLVSLISERLGREYHIVYSEKPNGQAGQGRINFKDYVLIGFSTTSDYGDDLFIKFEVSNIKESPVFGINIDLNFRKGTSYFQDQRGVVYKKTYQDWDIDDLFPNNWSDLINMIIEPVKRLENQLTKYLYELEQITFKGEIDEIMDYDKITSLLKFKKQIILQGPPGTGKTKLAKELASKLTAQQLASYKPSDISDKEIKKYVLVNDNIESAKGKSEYTINDINENNVNVSVKGETKEYKPSFKQIIQAYQTELWKGGQKNGLDPFAAAIAKHIYSKIELIKPKLEDLEQFKMVQFHPSYTYEDFVRGIVAEPNEIGTGIIYKPKDKLLADFAKTAQKNIVDSKKTVEVVSNENWVKHRIKDFQEYLENRLDRDEKIWLTPNTAYITRVVNDTIRYKGDNWKIDGGVPYGDLEKMYLEDISTLTEIRELTTLTLSAKSNTTYWQKLLELFKSYLNENNYVLPEEKISSKISLKNYVLIIDEINRANLSSVLGELIYALEYRDENVDSMYEVDGSNKITLPSNLYIIGTMNTADRSVGHIDYAIRRRFAFVDVLPEQLESNDSIVFHSEIFKRVSKLFISNYDEYILDKTIPIQRADYLSLEFDPKDIWLGHSYFIQKKSKNGEGEDIMEPSDFNIRVKYEIVSILKEYVKDGILNQNAIKEINNIEKDYGIV